MLKHGKFQLSLDLGELAHLFSTNEDVNKVPGSEVEDDVGEKHKVNRELKPEYALAWCRLVVKAKTERNNNHQVAHERHYQRQVPREPKFVPWIDHSSV